MSFDPAADPWGAAMLGAAGLWVISALLVVSATAKGGSRRTGGRVMLVSLIGFLGAASGGTWARIQAGSPAPTETEPAKTTSTPSGSESEGEPDVAGPTDTTGRGTGTSEDAGESSDGTGTDDGAETSDDSGTDGSGSTGEPAGETGDADGEPEVPEPAAVVGSKIPVVGPLPSEIEARDKEIRVRLRDADAVASSSRSCAKLDEVALAWASLRTLPPDGPGYRRAQRIAEDLDECRRKLLYSISRRHRRTQVDARDAFAEEIGERFETEHGLRVAVSISGMSHEKIRIGGSGLDAAKADALMDGGLRAELERLAFAQVVLSDTKVPKTYMFEVTPDNQLGVPDMREVGLGQTLELPAP